MSFCTSRRSRVWLVAVALGMAAWIATVGRADTFHVTVDGVDAADRDGRSADAHSRSVVAREILRLAPRKEALTILLPRRNLIPSNYLPEWRNWQTRWIQNPVSVKDVRVRVPPLVLLLNSCRNKHLQLPTGGR